MRKVILSLILFFMLTPAGYSEDEFLEGSIRFDEITEEICLEAPMSFKYDTGYREKTFKDMSAKEELSKLREKDPHTIFRKDNITLETTYKKGKSNNLTDTLENRQVIKYDKERFVLIAGISNNYEYTDLTKNSRKIFFSPQFKINEHILLGLNNALNTTSRTFEQGASVRYKPYFLKNTSFGLNGSVKQKENNTFTKKLEFNSEVYLW